MSDSCVIYALDIGDTCLRGGVHRNGVTTAGTSMPTPRGRTKDAEDRLLDAITQLLDRLAEDAPPMEALAVSANGILTLQPQHGVRPYGPFRDHELHVLAPNVDGLKYMPLVSRLESRVHVRVHVEKNVNAALHSLPELDDVICVNLDEGLGAGVKRNGRVDRMPGAWSCCEIAHGMRWALPDEMTRQCHCGTTVGCLEAAIGGWAMFERYGRRPMDADVETYVRMRKDVVEQLPLALAFLVEQSGIRHIVLSGRDAAEYARDERFLVELQVRTERLLEDGRPVQIDVQEFGEMAELHGASLALIENEVLASIG